MSRDPAELIAEVERLAADGVREVTLLGQNVNSYGRDLPQAERISFAELLARVDAVEGIERIRYTSPHPKDMREDVIRAHAELPSLCEHIHLPLQSGSSAVLKRMRRTYNRERYLDRVALIREHVPDCAITTDIIVGFPGETEDDFAETLEVVEEVGYDGAFTFVFSPRRGTEAAELDGQVPHPVKRERMERLVELVQRRARERAQRFVGRTMEVLVEGPSRTDSSRLRGRTRHNKTVNFDGTAAPGELVEVEIDRRHLDRPCPGASGCSAGSPAGRRCPSRRPMQRRSRSSARPRSARPAVAIELAEAAARARRGPGRDLLRLDPGLPGPRGPQRGGERRGASAARAPAGGLRRRSTRSSAPGASPSWPSRRSTRLLEEGRRPIVVGGTGLYLRAALSRLELRPPVPPEIRERGRARARRAGPGGAARGDSTRRRRAASTPATASGSRARSSCSGRASSRRPTSERRRALDRPACAIRPCWPASTMDREELDRRIDARVDGWSPRAPRRRRRRPTRAGASRTARAALGFGELLARRRRGRQGAPTAATPGAS